MWPLFNGFYAQIVLNNSAFVMSYTVEYLKLVHIAFSVPDDKLKNCYAAANVFPTHPAISLIVY